MTAAELSAAKALEQIKGSVHEMHFISRWDHEKDMTTDGRNYMLRLLKRYQVPGYLEMVENILDEQVNRLTD